MVCQTTDIHVGIVTATGGLKGIGISSAGTAIHSGIITSLNFIGAGNTFAVSGGNVDISIAGAAGGAVGQELIKFFMKMIFQLLNRIQISPGKML